MDDHFAPAMNSFQFVVKHYIGKKTFMTLLERVSVIGIAKILWLLHVMSELPLLVYYLPLPWLVHAYWSVHFMLVILFKHDADELIYVGAFF